MSHPPFIIRSSQVLIDGVLLPASILVEEGKIASLDPPKSGLPVHDVGDLVIMPGLVDSHVHINEPGRTDWEGFTTATRAAAAGGVTTVVDMPLNCLPVTTSAAAFQIKLDICKPSLWVDTGFWGGVLPDNAAELPQLAEMGALGAKAFLIDSGIPEFPETYEPELRIAMSALHKAGLPLLAHAEVDLGPDESSASPNEYSGFLASRPTRWEDEAIAVLIRLCRKTRCHVHIVHLSAATALPMLAAARAEGLPISVETCPHYLTLSAETIEDGRTDFKCCPPIREEANREALWQGLKDRVIDMVTTDHSPCTPNLKRLEDGDFEKAWGGISSLQLGMPLIWTEARQRGFSLADISRWMSSTPARIAGLDDRKGWIAEGFDADFVILDPDATHEITLDELYFKNKITPYRGKVVAGKVVSTYLRGAKIFHDGAFTHKPMGEPLLHRSKQS